jgi:Holliday junction resolvasome RuvABC endonuclease subunit
MSESHETHSRILAVAPSSAGLGFAILEGKRTLVNWGVKAVTGDKNAQSLLKVQELIEHYQPSVLVFEDYSGKNSRRSHRIRTLGRQMVQLAQRLDIPVMKLLRREVRKCFFGDGKGSKDAVAEIIAKTFPEELALRLPPKRRAWMAEDYRMGIFDAVALAVALRAREMQEFIF